MSRKSFWQDALSPDLLLELVEQSEIGTVRALGREFARRRLERTPSTNEAENARRQIQKWLDGSGIGIRNLRLLAAALETEPDSLLLPEPVADDPFARIEAKMDGALNNQQRVFDSLRELIRAVNGLRELIESQHAEEAGRRSPQRKKRAG